MAGKDCICGDIEEPHSADKHKRSLVPVVFLGLLLGAGYVNAKKTGRCLCGDIVKKFTGKRPHGAS